jgi:MFS family permease
MAAFRESLLRSDRDFRWYWAGQTLSYVGTQASAVAMPLIAALTLDSGAGGVSAVATAAFLPNLLFPLVVGHWLEARAKSPVMIVADLLRAVLLAAVPVAYAVDALSLPLLVGAAFLIGTASVVFDIAGFAYLPIFVAHERLPNANRALQGSASVAQVGGPGLGGLIVQLVGPPAALAADAVSYLASAVGVAAARRREPAGSEIENARALDGVRLLLRNLYLRALTVHAAVYNAASQILTVNLVVWAVQVRDVSVAMYGLALSGGGVGAFAGTMAALRVAERRGYGRAFAISLLLSTGPPLLIAALPFTGVALGLTLAGILGVAGVGLGSANVLSITLRQVIIPPTQLSRTTGGYRLIMYGSIPLGSAMGGVLGVTFGSRAGVAMGAIGLAASALPMLTRAVRSLREPGDAASAPLKRSSVVA